MKLSQFKELNKKKRMILISGIGIVLLVAVVLVYRTYAIYQENQNFNVIKGSVPEYLNDYDIKLAVTVDGTLVSKFPSKDSGMTVSSIDCDKGASAVWNYESWGPNIKNVTETRTKCQVNFVTKYTDSVLNGSDPVLGEGLIPVMIDDSGVVRKANESSEWYNYTNKTWANAVILENENIVYQNGEVIPEENIESYFVWIPRYRYKIFNEGNYEGLSGVENKVQTIEIEFENKEKSVSNGSKVGEWLTHPAFISFHTNGIWVGKFEVGYKDAKNKEEAQVNGGYVSKVVTKPNVYSWRRINASNAFIVSYDYQRGLDSHLMKNTEWGAVAFLQHSAYGSQTSVRVNNNESFITGYAAKSEPTCGYIVKNDSCNVYESTSLGMDGTYTVNYNNNASVVASTTGNYSGVYDMSGGAWEFVMGVMRDENGNLVSGRNDKLNSGFIGILTNPADGMDKTKSSWTESDGGIPFPESKYYDAYAYATDDKHFNRRILGDATGEMGPFAYTTYGTQTRQIGSWYQDEAWFVGHGFPWFVRGGGFDYGLDAGVFSFDPTYGSISSYSGFRVVLAI